MIPIIKWTLWQRRWSTFWWSIGLFAFIFITMVFYPTFKNSASELEKSFANLPKAALQLFGGSSDFFSPVGFLNSQIFFFMLPLLLTMLAVAIGSALIAREEQDMTIELLLARPISRGKLILGKIIAGIIVLLIVAGLSLITIVITSRVFDLESISSAAIALASFNAFLLALCTGAISFLLAATGRARGAAIGIGAVVGVAGYVISSLAGTVEWLRAPAKILPFNYYQSEAILRETYHWTSALYFVAVTLVCGILSYIVFRRRDIA